MIKPPKDCYFIHGVHNWNKSSNISITSTEICCSLQLDSKTKPIRPYGYILRLANGSVVSAFDTDVSSEIINGKKKLKLKNNFKNYKSTEFESLIENTRIGYHNELWVDSLGVEISGAYVSEIDSIGRKSFIKSCNRDNLEIHYI